MPSSSADWPTQPRPHNTVWSLWRRALSDGMCSKTQRHVTVTRPGVLTAPLGDWCADYNPQASPRWKSFFSQSTQRLFVPVRHQPARFQQLSASARLAFGLACYDIRGTPVFISASDLPADAMPAQPTTGGSFLRVNRPHTPSIPSPLPVPTTNSFPDHIAALPPWQNDLLQGTSQANKLYRLCQHLRAGTRLLLCSDRGAKQHMGSFRWAIATATATTILWECSGRATGWFANSFRSEGIGQLALLAFLEASTCLSITVLHRTLGSASPLTIKASSNASPRNLLRQRSSPVLA
jgi:hypothetical protein